MTQRPLKVLFLTRYPVQGASSRYRVFQYLPFLEKLGVQADVQSLMDADMYALSTQPGQTMRKIWATVCAVARRLWALRKWRQYDLIYLQRELLPFGPPIIERWLKRRGAVVMFDYDDALFIHKSSRYTPLASLVRSPDKVRQLFTIVDCTVAGNNWLRDAARADGGVAETLEVAEDTARIPMHAPHTNDRPVTIGWLGSPSTVKYLHLIAPVLRDIAARFPDVRFRIMGGGNFCMEGVPWQLSDWSIEAELEALADFDIGLMPLPSEDWAKGKSGGKARTYMAAGVVPVCAAIGYNNELLTDGQTGFLCASPEDWTRALEAALDDAQLRQRIASAARAEVETRFDLEATAGKMRQLFDRVLEARS
ncbi:glycosyltransferase family 4 protein [Thalassovita sp.]|jgi:glycosyltransferase involved in cell wall biosynthesis|uniref:glycosyltransferase family 4 protein n=1 Tax=Thalassovita sp. TaxID=1979401 RepID=UPI003B5A5B10